MATAVINVNTHAQPESLSNFIVAGHAGNLPLNMQVNLTATVSGVSTYLWTLVLPTGSSASLNDTSSAMPHFTPDVVGSYLVTLSCNAAGAASTQVAVSAVCVVRDPKTFQRIPAFGESTQASLAQGWATDQNRQEAFLLAQAADPLVVSAVNGDNPLVVGAPVQFNGSTNDPSVVTDPPSVTGVSKIAPVVAGPTSSAMQIGIVLGRADGVSGSTPTGGIARVRVGGLYTNALGNGITADDASSTVYVSNAGGFSLTPGDHTWAVGYVVAAPNGTDAYLQVTQAATPQPLSLSNMQVTAFTVDDTASLVSLKLSAMAPAGALEVRLLPSTCIVKNGTTSDAGNTLLIGFANAADGTGFEAAIAKNGVADPISLVADDGAVLHPGGYLIANASASAVPSDNKWVVMTPTSSTLGSACTVYLHWYVES